MKHALILILVLALPLASAAQDVVKVNILEIAGKIPPPPGDVKEAFSRTAIEHPERSGSESTRNAAGFYTPVMDKLDATKEQIGKAIEVLSKPQADAMKEMDQKEMQKKVQSMSKEEQMKFAMEMSKKMGMGPKAYVPESKDVMAAQEECMNLAQAAGTDMQTYQADHAGRENLIKEREAKHAEVQKWQEEEAKKLPQVNYGEMGGPEPKAEYALLTKAMNKHLEVENNYLKGVQKEWKKVRDKYDGRYGPLQQKLAKIRYGEDAKNQETKRQLLTGQSMMVSGSGELAEMSRKATEDAAFWWVRKLALEESKPKE